MSSIQCSLKKKRKKGENYSDKKFNPVGTELPTYVPTLPTYILKIPTNLNKYSCFHNRIRSVSFCGY